MLQKLRTYARLGLANIVRVAWYQLRLRTGWFARNLPIEAPQQGDFFKVNQADSQAPNHAVEAQPAHLLFGWQALPLNTPPDWHCSVLTGQTHQQPALHWTAISDFQSGIGDIKGLWEPSRFGWSLDFVRLYSQTGDPVWIDTLNHWLNDWSEHNPANQGANWKCAQETSFRILHLAASSIMLEQTTPSDTLTGFLRSHLKRIQPTLGYARAQDNNHGTSEAAALYIGASWLLRLNPQDRALTATMKLGERYLEERANRLISDDGTFSQYSVTYHRVMLQTFNLVELWRRHLQLPRLSDDFYRQAGRAASWLVEMIDGSSGDAPNLGTNDGAHILNFTGSDFRDFRSEAELACQLFDEATAFDVVFPTGLSRLLPSELCKRKQPTSTLFGSGGFVTLRGQRAWSVMRAPRFQFRPGQADLLHLDVWLDGRNILRDAGSFSYNTEAKWLNYFPSVAAHNTVQFDAQDQMPRLSRFLYAEWPGDDELTLDNQGKRKTAAYSDWQGHRHHREVILADNSLTINDTISGVSDKATLRWRILPTEWTQENNVFSAEGLKITVNSVQSLTRLALAEGAESRYYGQKSALPVIEADFTKDNQITTIINWT